MVKRFSIVLNITFILALFYVIVKRYYTQTPESEPYHYANNYQYQEQTEIFPAYTSPCDIMFIGDSHIYKCHWDELLGRPTCNRGIGSDVTEGILSRVGEIISARPKTCFILCGVNDLEWKVPVKTIVNNYRLIVDTLKKSGITPVIMRTMHVGQNYEPMINPLIDRLNDLLSRIGIKTLGVTLVQDDYQPDQIHLKASGYLKWKEVIRQYYRGQ